MKTCSKCKAEKPLEAFSKQSSAKDGRYYQCKSCKNFNRTKVPGKPRPKRNRITAADRRASQVEYKKGYQKKRRWHSNILLRVFFALKRGQLVKTPCEVCGNEKVHGHHDDYNKPLEVRWLCVKHHSEWHLHNTPIYPTGVTSL